MSLKRLLPEMRPFMRLFDNESALSSGPLGRYLSPLSGPTLFGREDGSNPWFHFPPVDLKETGRAYLIDAELPGVEKDNITIECTDDRTLTLKGHVGSTHEHQTEPTEPQEAMKIDDSDGVIPTGAEKAERAKASAIMRSKTKATAHSESASSDLHPTFWHSERFSGSFLRSFTFPTPVQPDQVQAKFRNGLLHISVPKVEKKGVKINVHADN